MRCPQLDNQSCRLIQPVCSLYNLIFVITIYGGNPTDCLKIPRNTAVQFDWRMAAPNDVVSHVDCLDPRDDLFDPATYPLCPIAWNSFAYTVDEAKDEDGNGENDPGALSLLPAEPIKVGIRAAPDVDPYYDLGDYVWLDVHGQQNDGIQQPEEPGINGIALNSGIPLIRYLLI